MEFYYMVVCLDEFGLVQATRQIWRTEEAAERYRLTVAPSRKPQLVQILPPSEYRIQES